jgi:hypothetical protein
MTQSRPQFATCPDTCPQGRRRNVAVVRREPRKPADSTAVPRRSHGPSSAAKIAALAPHCNDVFSGEAVDNAAAADLYTRPWHAAAAWRVGVPRSPSLSSGEHPAKSFGPWRMCGLRRLLLPFPPGRGSAETGPARVSGCLTSESEERETWTAESLRAAFAIGKPIAQSGRKRLRRSTFQVNTMIVTVSNHRNGQSGTSSNVVISRDQISST